MVDREIEEQIGGGDLWHDALEGGVRLDGGGPLDPTAITAADHADLPVRPALLGDPINRVVAVLALVSERDPLAVALITAPRVLNDVYVTAPGPPFACEFREVFPAVWRSLEDCGIFAILGRADNFGDEFYAIAHFDPDALLGLRLHRGLAQLRVERGRVYQKGIIA